MSEAPKKSLKQVRIYMDPADADIFEKLRQNIRLLSETELAKLLVSASLHAVRENDYALPLPLEFQIRGRAPDPRASYLNEPAKKR